ncbi:hypothetical protein Tco_0912910 [Tanacetum coccineum]
MVETGEFKKENTLQRKELRQKEKETHDSVTLRIYIVQNYLKNQGILGSFSVKVVITFEEIKEEFEKLVLVVNWKIFQQGQRSIYQGQEEVGNAGKYGTNSLKMLFDRRVLGCDLGTMFDPPLNEICYLELTTSTKDGNSFVYMIDCFIDCLPSDAENEASRWKMKLMGWFMGTGEYYEVRGFECWLTTTKKMVLSVHHD